jgi:hypothetical protein
MKALLLRSLIAAVLIGLAISFVSRLTFFHSAIKYEPPFSEAERQQMRNLPMNEVEATLAKRRIKMTRWQWAEDSIHYSYFWKDVGRDAIVSSSGVFLACIWVGWMEMRRAQKPEGQHLPA